MADDKLIGSWESDMDDPVTRKQVGKVRMEFYRNGTLGYVIFEKGKMQIIKLTYKVDRNLIVTDQPSSGRVQRSQFQICRRALRLLYDSQWVMFKRVD